MSETVYLLLPVHNRRKMTAEFVQCLRAQTYAPCHLVLIDDGSSDGSADMVLQALPDATVIRGNGRWWWAGSLHQAFRWLKRVGASDESVVLIMNNDTRFEPDFIESGVDVLARNPRTLLLSMTRDQATGNVIESGVHADLRTLEFRLARDGERINCLSTRGLFLRWGEMKNIGGFHPVLLPHYWSDYEYTIRACRMGYNCLTHPSVALLADWTTTGNREVQHLSGWEFIRTLFSPRTVANPVYQTMFVILAVPARWVPRHLIHIWRKAIVDLLCLGVVKPLLGRDLRRPRN